MSFMKGAMLLLLLAAASTNAAPDDCGGLNRTMPGADLHKVIGDWVLVRAVSDNSDILVESLTNSHVQMHLLPDNITMIFEERNSFRNSSCTKYNATMTIVPDLHKLVMVGLYEDKDGVVGQFNDSAIVQFFVTCPDCLEMAYEGTYGWFLLSYRREGHHQNLEKNAEAHGDFQKLSECLGHSVEGGFTYQGEEAFCHKTSQA